MLPRFFDTCFVLLMLQILWLTFVDPVYGSTAPSSIFATYTQASWNTLCSGIFGDKHKGEDDSESIANRQTLVLNVAQIAANLASIAYCYDFAAVRQWRCTRCHLVPEFVLEESIVVGSWDVHCYIGYYPPWNAKVIAFRGTDSSQLRNWAENLRTTQHHVRINGAGLEDCHVHDGFSRTWNIAFKERVLNALDVLLTKYGNDGPLYITGHSAGGATAQLAAVNIKLMGKVENIHLYTFGAPRVGDHAFARKVTQLMTESWRFTHAKDIVPTLPWKSMGFWHSGQEVFEHKHKTHHNTVATEYRTCDGSGEDPHGHNSMCPYGFGCDSVSDHYVYMNRVMSNDGVC
eukprot:g2877.t1